MIRRPPRSTPFPYTPLFRSLQLARAHAEAAVAHHRHRLHRRAAVMRADGRRERVAERAVRAVRDRKSTRLNSSHSQISYAVFCLKKKKNTIASSSSPTHEET